jgi:sugar transferase EpsL
VRLRLCTDRAGSRRGSPDQVSSGHILANNWSSTASAVRSCTTSQADIFRAFFAELEDLEIEYAILHGYSGFPESIPSDVDFVVNSRYLARLHHIVARISEERGWVIAQVLRHSLSSRYFLLVDPLDPAKTLALDACSHLDKSGFRLMRAEELLQDRKPSEGGFYVPATAAEFGCILAKAILYRKNPSEVVPRLKALYAADPDRVHQVFTRLTGRPGSDLNGWLEHDDHTWGHLRAEMLATCRSGWTLRACDLLRRMRNVTRPTGFRVSVLGPDGSGKSTLISGLKARLAPTFFGEPVVFKFRPDVTNRIVPSVDDRPHDRDPRSRPVSVLKVAFYAADWWWGWLTRLVPLQLRGSLILFDRDFSDLTIDQRRYLVQSVGVLAAALRHLVPRPSRTYVLDALPEEAHSRKPELPLSELERQMQAYRTLVGKDRRMRLVDANRPKEEVVASVAHDVVLRLASRECLRSRPTGSRCIDVIVAGGGLIVLAPGLAALSLAVRLRLGSPVLFRQERPGLMGEAFTMYKFRTMTAARNPETGRPRPDAERMTSFGTALRKTSLDELPELVNVLRGEMSLVGPRPLLMEYLPRYSPAQMRRHSVPPGLTGWAQVSGRNAVTWEEKFALDVRYVDERSLGLYLRILFKTASVVLTGKGISPSEASAGRFLGATSTSTEDIQGAP